MGARTDKDSKCVSSLAGNETVKETTRQGRSIVVFTMVTIVFVGAVECLSKHRLDIVFDSETQLPLSFMSSVFGMNAREFDNGNIMNLHEQITYMSKI